MTNTNDAAQNKKSAFRLITVKVALVLCAFIILSLFPTSLHFTDAGVMRYRDVEFNDYNIFGLSGIQKEFLYVAIAIIAGVVISAVLFLTDHPKLSLISSFAALMGAFVSYSVQESMTASDVSITAWSGITLFLCLVLFVMGFVVRKVNRKVRKQADRKE